MVKFSFQSLGYRLTLTLTLVDLLYALYRDLATFWSPQGPLICYSLVCPFSLNLWYHSRYNTLVIKLLHMKTTKLHILWSGYVSWQPTASWLALPVCTTRMGSWEEHTGPGHDTAHGAVGTALLTQPTDVSGSETPRNIWAAVNAAEFRETTPT